MSPRSISRLWPVALLLVTGGIGLFTVLPPQSATETPPSAPADPPYASSARIIDVTFDWGTHRRLAPGSDNWPLTWAADGHQYTSWGDGGGFGGTNTRHRVSLGVARIVGDPGDYRGENVWGALGNSEAAATLEGKSYGILALGDSLYMWVSPGSGVSNWTLARLYRSVDGGHSWAPTPVVLESEDSLGVPAFLQQGKDHKLAGDGYVYTYATEILDPDSWEVQKPGRIHLMRAPRGEISDPEAWRYFREADGETDRWTSERWESRPVFRDANGVMRNSAIRTGAAGPYLLVTNHTARNEGNLGIFDAPTPWGPWTTVLYQSGWARELGPPTGFYWMISPAWLGEGGQEFVMVFTGKEQTDSWNSVEGRFTFR